MAAAIRYVVVIPTPPASVYRRLRMGDLAALAIALTCFLIFAAAIWAIARIR